MNEREIIQWLRQAQGQATIAWKNTEWPQYRNRALAFKEAADYIETTIKERHAANIEALNKPPIR